MTIRVHYWSNSKLVSKVRAAFGYIKPKAATHSDWKKWKKDYRTARPFCYWLTEELPGIVQDYFCGPSDLLDKVYYKLNARFKDRYFGMTSSLNKWQYHEVDTRILYCNFQTFIDFIEVEMAHCFIYDDDRQKKYNYKWYHKSRVLSFFIPEWRSPEAGLEHLRWKSELRFNEEYVGDHNPELLQEFKDSGKYNTLTHEAIHAIEVLALYEWWTITRPNRPDPHEVSGFNKYYGNLDDIEDILDRPKGLTEEKSREMYSIMNKIEEDYENEDTDMLVRLMKIRRGLWT